MVCNSKNVKIQNFEEKKLRTWHLLLWGVGVDSSIPRIRSPPLATTYSDIRSRILNEIEQLLLLSRNMTINMSSLTENTEIFTQFILDPTSFNLKHRLNLNDPIVEHMFKLSRDLCYGIHTERIRQIKNTL